MKLIIGLGNDDNRFAGTRHNAGFIMLDHIADTHGTKWSHKDKFKAHIAEVAGDDKVILAKPTTYYNSSGDAARAICDFYKIDPQDMLVIHDELALPFGTIRARQKGSDAGNNGIKSVISTIGPDFPRIRIGIANDHKVNYDAADFVLSRFNAEESKKLPDIAQAVTNLVDTFIRTDVDFDHTSITV